MRLIYRSLLAGFGMFLAAQTTLADAMENPHIENIAGMYGKPGAKHVLDITEPLPKNAATAIGGNMNSNLVHKLIGDEKIIEAEVVIAPPLFMEQ